MTLALPCKVYPMTQEDKALLKLLQEQEKKGYICPSISPYTSPFFFIQKKDRKLRPVQDYRHINDITISNQYPLLLITELLLVYVLETCFKYTFGPQECNITSKGHILLPIVHCKPLCHLSPFKAAQRGKEPGCDSPDAVKCAVDDAADHLLIDRIQISNFFPVVARTWSTMASDHLG
jgi:hypothetical protein